MDGGSSWKFILLFICVVFSALFSSSETSLMSISKIRIRYMLDNKVRGAKLLYTLLEKPNKLLGTILVGNNIVNIAASAIATSLAIDYFGDKGVGIATIVMTLLILIFSEITPKSYAAHNSEKVAIRVSKIIYLSMLILTPITKIINLLTSYLLRLIGMKGDKKRSFTEEELKTIINVSHEEGILESREREMIHNVFEFTDVHVKDVMIPRTDVCFISSDISYKDLLDTYRNVQFSRFPVYKGSLDNIIGMLNIKDLVLLEDSSEFSIEDWLKPPYFTYEFKWVRRLLEEMRNDKISVAIVLDEYGGTAGIITIEDIVEEVFGEIEDEYDDEKKEIELVNENEYIVEGISRIELINELIGLDIEAENYDTIGGFIIAHLGYLPEKGDEIEYKGTRFEVLKVRRNRIEKLKIKPD